MNAVTAVPSTLTLVTLFVQMLMALAFLGGGAIFLVKMGRMMGVFEQTSIQHAANIEKIEIKIESLSKVMTTVAVQKEEMIALRRDLTRTMDAVADMRRGRGFIIRDQPAAPEGHGA